MKRITFNTISDHPIQTALWIGFIILQFIVFPGMADPVWMPKLIISGIYSLIVFSGVCVYRIIQKKPFILHINSTTIGFFLLSAISLISTLATPGNSIEAISSTFGILTFIPFCLLILSTQNEFSSKDKRLIDFTLVAIGIFYSVSAAIVKVTAIQNEAVQVFLSRSPLASGFALFIVCVVCTAIIIRHMRSTAHQTEQQLFIHIVISTIPILLLVLGAMVGLLTVKEELMKYRQPYAVQWSIMTRAFSLPRFALLGVSPERYLEASSLERPIQLNTGILWNTRITTAGFLPFHIGTTLGIGGLLSILYIFFVVLRNVFLTKNKKEAAVLLLLAAGTLFHPPNHSLYILLCILIYLYASKHRAIQVTFLQKIPVILQAVILTIPIFLSLAGSVGLYILFKADLEAGKTVAAMAAGNAKDAYTHITTAISLNPLSSTYRRLASELHANTAFTLLNTKQSEKKELTPEEQSTVTSLMSQSIQEAQKAIALNNSLLNWELIGNIYANLIQLADNAPAFAVSSYQELINRDPNNPIVYLNYGRILEQSGETNMALYAYLTALEKRNSYTEAWIALGQLYERNNNPELAKNAYEQAKNYMSQESPIYQELLNKITQLSEIIPSPSPTPLPTQEATSSAIIPLE